MIVTNLECFLDSALIDLILRQSVEVFPKDGILFRQGDRPDSLYLIKYGEVILSLPAGDGDIRFRAGRGSLLGVPSVLSDQPHSMTARASWDTEVYQLRSEVFQQLLETEPRMQPSVLLILAAEVSATRKAISNLLSESGG